VVYVFAPGDGPPAPVFCVVAAGDDPLGVGDDGAVVEEDVDGVLRRQQGGDVALQDEIGLPGALDGLDHLWVGGVDQVADLAADRLLPVGQRVDVRVDTRGGRVAHGGLTIPGLPGKAENRGGGAGPALVAWAASMLNPGWCTVS